MAVIIDSDNSDNSDNITISNINNNSNNNDDLHCAESSESYAASIPPYWIVSIHLCIPIRLYELSIHLCLHLFE